MRANTSLLLCLAVVSGLFSAAAFAGALSNVQVSKESGRATVDIHLSCSFRYDGHEPRGVTREIKIDLIPIGQCAAFRPNEPLLEMRRPTGGELAALSEVEFANRGGQVSLIVRFTDPLRVTVSQSGSLRSVRLVVDSSDGVKPEFLVAAERAAQATANAAPAQVPRREMPTTFSMRADKQAAVATTGAFVINLLTAREAPAPIAVVNGIDGKQLYTSVTETAGSQWHNLRVGFYNSEGRAEAALQSLRADYPDALVVRVDAAEFQVAARNPVSPTVAELPVAVAGVPVAATGMADSRLAELLEEGQAAMLAANYPAAIQIYTKVLREGESPYAPDALEYLGLARERNGQSAHAVSEYRRYLARYPDGNGAYRVQQRLDGLVLAAPPASAMSGSQSVLARNDARESRWDVYGGIAQYYRRDVSDFDEQGTRTTQSAVLSDMDLITRRRGERFDIATRMTLGNYYDLLSEDEGSGSDSRFYYLYADLADRDLGLSARIGRQTLHTSGVLGRFDGTHVAWQFRPDWRVNFMTGEPVYSTSSRVDSDRSFYGVSVDAFDVGELVDLSFFYNTQQVDGIDDREALGGEMRYYDERRSLVSFVDYDIGYNVLNSVVALGNWTFDNRVTLNASFDFRRSPYLLTENALVGQEADTIDELLDLFSEGEIRDLAEDRSGELTTLTLGFSRPLYERLQINADVTMADFSGTPASANVPESPGLGAEYYYNLSLVGSSLLKEGDTSIFTLRFLDGSNVSTTSLSLDTRYPVSERLRINPRLLISRRDFSSSDSSELLAIPALRLFYQFRERTRLEFEMGARWSDLDTSAGAIGTTSWFLYTGYRTDF